MSKADYKGILIHGVVSLVVALIAAAINPIARRVGVGEYQIPQPLVIAVAIGALVWAGAAFITAANRRCHRATGYGGPRVSPGKNIAVIPVMRLEHKGVVWRVVRWEGLSRWMDDRPRRVDSRDLIVETPPRCPKCNTEISEKYRFWGRWKWYCPACDFSAIARRSYELESADVGKIARSRFG